MAMKLSKCP